jgi:hypothetical protein
MPQSVRPLTTELRWLFLVGSGLGAIAGTQLFIGTEHTDQYFAWTIQSHLTAAFLGATYYSAILLFVVSALEPFWARARIAAIVVFSVVTLILIAVLAHLDLFHTDSDRAVTLVGTWALIGNYAVFPVFLAGGPPPPPGVPPPRPPHPGPPPPPGAGAGRGGGAGLAAQLQADALGALVAHPRRSGEGGGVVGRHRAAQRVGGEHGEDAQGDAGADP